MNKMVMKLDKQSEAEMAIRRPGCGIVFIKVADSDIRAIEFFPGINNTLRTLPIVTKGLHEAIEDLFKESKRNKNKEGKRKEKLRWYLKEAIRLAKESEKLEEQSESYLNLVDHSFTEAQRDIIWDDDTWGGRGLSSLELLEKAVDELKIEEEVSE